MSQTTNQHYTVLGIDLEGMNEDLQNNGVNIAKDRVIEIGAVLWDWHHAMPVKMQSELIDEVDRLPMSEEVTLITGIYDETLTKWGAKGSTIHQILGQLAALMEQADYLMAHNGPQYDIPMLEGMFKRYDIPMPQKQWIDSMTDIEYPKKIRGRSMALLEHEHGFVNPFPHRAVTDVLSMLKLASGYPIERMIKLAKSPVVTLVASLNAPNWKDQKAVAEFNAVKNKVAKSRFRWNPSTKQWLKDIPKVLLDEGKINYDFDFIIREK
jgi:DNA polymerase-3 subunit epsilon